MPSEASKIYNQPVHIDEGTTVIRAVFISNDGLRSEEAGGTYKIVLDYPSEPQFSVNGGDYDSGFYVTITADRESTVYYTTNGEEPDVYSKVYRNQSISSGTDGSSGSSRQPKKAVRVVLWKKSITWRRQRHLKMEQEQQSPAQRLFRPENCRFRQTLQQYLYSNREHEQISFIEQKNYDKYWANRKFLLKYTEFCIT